VENETDSGDASRDKCAALRAGSAIKQAARQSLTAVSVSVAQDGSELVIEVGAGESKAACC